MAKKNENKDKKKNNFVKELKAELKKVTWPTFKKLVNNTSAVISVVLIVSIVVFILDVCFENLNKFGVEGIKTLVSSSTQETNENTESKGSVNLDNSMDLVPNDEKQGEDTTESVGIEQQTEETTVDSETQVNNNSEAEVVE